MSLTKLTENLNVHQSLPDQPSQTASELKRIFDSAGNMIKEYINDTLTSEVDTKFASEDQNINTNAQNINQTNTNLANTTARVGTLETNMTNATSRISSLESNMTNTRSRLSTEESYMTNARSRISTLETTTANLPGQIIQQGANGSAKYTKYSDGTLIQYGKVTLKTYDPRSSGGLTYWSKDDTVTLPANFKDTNYVVTTNVEVANMNIFTNSYGIPSAKDKVRISYMATQDEESRIIDFICIGRWK